eukprot:GILJ01008170.1.p1 GENE.GILJ01008170.1~~GILJ01008170.1.p1  ORF type:complete len:1161 (-),score=175.55 GILJ01008170.1:1939-5382(-)
MTLDEGNAFLAVRRCVPDALVETHANLLHGKLPNGLRYFVLPHRYPPGRFQAYLGVNVGSRQEQQHEQGIAHFLEHCVFLGTDKFPTADSLRKELAELGMSFGGDTNAFTDFHETVYTLNAPTRTQIDEDDANKKTSEHVKSKDGEVSNVYRVLDILHELAFRASLVQEVLDLEKGAVLSEAQMRNTVEYRVEKRFYEQVHEENILPQRFPIGLPELIERFDAETVRSFYSRWYRPSNMILYIVGDVDSTLTQYHIESLFGGESDQPVPSVEPLHHRYLQSPSESLVLFQHPLLHVVSISFNLKDVLVPTRTRQDVFEILVDSTIDLVLSSRIDAIRQSMADPPFLSVDWSFANSVREGCSFHSVAVSVKPRAWQHGTILALREVHRLFEFGVPPGELRVGLATVLKSAKDEAEQVESTHAEDIIEAMMEDVNLGSVIDSPVIQFAEFQRLAPLVTEDVVNARCRMLFDFVRTPLDSLQGPASLFVCAPTATTPTANLPGQTTTLCSDATGGHDFPFISKPALPLFRQIHQLHSEGMDRDMCAVADEEALVISNDELIRVLKEATVDVTPPVDIFLPDSVVTAEELGQLLSATRPCFVPIDSRIEFPLKQVMPEPVVTENGPRLTDISTGIVCLKLSNGIRINYKKTSCEPNQCEIYLCARGGQALESADTQGCTDIGLRTMLTGGAGGLSVLTLSKLCLLWGASIHSGVESDHIWVQLGVSVSDGGLHRAFQLLHVYLRRPHWDESAFERVRHDAMLDKQHYATNLERKTYDSLLLNATNGDARFVEPTLSSFQHMTLQTARATVERLLVSGNMELSVVGDIDPPELEQVLLKYVGTLPNTGPLHVPAGMIETDSFRFPIHQTSTHTAQYIEDDAERAVIYLLLPFCNRFGQFSNTEERCIVQSTKRQRLGSDATRRSVNHKPPVHPLHSYRCASIWSHVLNNRLFQRIREEQGLCYSIEWSPVMYEFLHGGVALLTLTPFPDKLQRTLTACLELLNRFKSEPLTDAEVDEARRPLISSIQSAFSQNSYWMQLLQHLSNPNHPKDLRHITDIVEHYQSITKRELEESIQALLDPSVVHLAIGVSGSGLNQVNLDRLTKHMSTELHGSNHVRSWFSRILLRARSLVTSLFSSWGFKPKRFSNSSAPS